METNIKSTMDYDMFKFSPLNRKPSYKHVKQLIDAIQENNQLDINPILVSKDGYILSGQHRFIAAKTLKVPIYYIQKDDVDDMYILTSNQNQRKCDLKDTVNFFANHKNHPEYIELERLMKLWKIPVGSICCMLGNQTFYRPTQIHTGKFKFRHEPERREQIIEQYTELKTFLDTMPFNYTGVYKTRTFCVGLSKFMDRDINWDTFMKKIRMHWPFLDCAMPSASKWDERFLYIYKRRGKASTDDGLLDPEQLLF